MQIYYKYRKIKNQVNNIKKYKWKNIKKHLQIINLYIKIYTKWREVVESGEKPERMRKAC